MNCLGGIKISNSPAGGASGLVCLDKPVPSVCDLSLPPLFSLSFFLSLSSFPCSLPPPCFVPASVAKRLCEGGQLQAPTLCTNPGNLTWPSRPSPDSSSSSSSTTWPPSLLWCLLMGSSTQKQALLCECSHSERLCSRLLLRLALATYEPTLDGGPDDMTVVDVTTLRRQVGPSITLRNKTPNTKNLSCIALTRRALFTQLTTRFKSQFESCPAEFKGKFVILFFFTWIIIIQFVQFSSFFFYAILLLVVQNC